MTSDETPTDTAAAPGAREKLAGELAEYARTVSDDMDAAAAIARRREITARLDELYWELVANWQSAQALAERPRPLDEETRLLIDAGVMDVRLAARELPEKLRAEWAQTAGARVVYLSEWLQERLAVRRAESELGSAGTRNGPSYVSHLETTRQRILAGLAPLMEGLPGTPREIVAAFRSGVLDEQLLRLGVALLSGGKRRDFLRRSRLRAVRDGLIARLRQRVENPAQGQCLDMLREIYRKDWAERYHQAALEQVEKQADPEAALRRQPENKLRESLARDLDAVRAAADRAARAAGEEKDAPTCWADRPRLTREAVFRTLAFARGLDREGAEPPVVLLVPGQGRGVYDAEIDGLVLTLRPAVGVDDSVAAALASWRIHQDAAEHGGALAAAFARRFPGRDFRAEFPDAYRVWLCRAAKGEADALSEDWWEFFRDFVGPPLDGPVIPANLRQLSAMTRMALRQRLERQLAQPSGDANLYRRFGALCWLDGLRDEAREHLKEALRRAPDDGEIALSLGLALRADGQEEAARQVFALGAERARHTIWGLYCQDAGQGPAPPG